MNNLIKKFRKDNLSAQEFEKLRLETNESKPEDLETAMQSDWMGEECPDLNPNQEIKNHILDNLHSSIELKRKFKLKVISLSVAACICVVLIMGALYMNFESNVIDTPLNFTTAKNENATVVLPDNSEIKLNENSDLTYLPVIFKKSNREIEFTGEGYFKIAHDKNNPFTIKSGQLEITVKGTEFNLTCNHACNTSTLYLVEGSVEMYSHLSHKNINVLPGQLIEYNMETGEFKMTTPKETNNISSWYSGEIRFDNEPLPKVISFLENHYRVDLKIVSHPDHMDENNMKELYFNGTLPTKNLPLAIKALEKVYRLKIQSTEH